MNVIEPLRKIRGDLHSRHPRGQNSELRVLGISQTIRQVCTFHEVVDEENVLAGDRSAEELDDATVVAAAYDGEKMFQLGRLDLAAELALENDGVFAAKGAAPAAGGGRSGVVLGEEVVGSGAELGVVVDVGVLGEGNAEAGERGAARD